MAKQNRDYGIGFEFLAWALIYVFFLVLLIMWVYSHNFDNIPKI